MRYGCAGESKHGRRVGPCNAQRCVDVRNRRLDDGAGLGMSDEVCGSGISELVAQLLSAVHRVDRHEDCTQPCDGQEAVDELRAIAHIDTDSSAFHGSLVREPPGDRCHVVAQLRPCRRPSVIAQSRGVGAGLGPVGERLGETMSSDAFRDFMWDFLRPQSAQCRELSGCSFPCGGEGRIAILTSGGDCASARDGVTGRFLVVDHEHSSPQRRPLPD
jgi:hypothetical protein